MSGVAVCARAGKDLRKGSVFAACSVALNTIAQVMYCYYCSFGCGR